MRTILLTITLLAAACTSEANVVRTSGRQIDRGLRLALYHTGRTVIAADRHIGRAARSYAGTFK